MPPYAPERIEKEVAHLKKLYPSRYKRRGVPVTRIISCLVLGLLLGLYFMDPFLYAFHKSEAIRAYLYLHHYGSDQEAQALLATRIFSDSEIRALDSRYGSFQDYFASPAQADQTANTIVNYLNGVTYLHLGKYDQLDSVGKLRYFFFFRTGLLPPTDWSFLTPTAN
ncbi:hypothetical protein OAG63_00745 [Methylacidiphilales bacterium]|nr:hypothetical protein [Candidatus Methylacidiphilales bacterium]MDB4793540.1 hypothetical protein [Candidatus Methylacidiphilales bacterium]